MGVIRIPTVLLLAALLPTPVLATHPQQCPEGTYQVDGAPIFPGVLTVEDAIVIDHRMLAIASGCPPTPVVVRQVDGGWMVHARWRECRGAKHVYLRAKISGNCSRMRGVVMARSPEKFQRRFTASQCTSESCDRVCTDSGQCSGADYCAKELGQCDARGKCMPRPEACPDIYLPVCGCDGQTYSNACDAAAAGATVAKLGRCDRRCDVTHPCDPGQFCELPVGVCASALDAGMCVDVPDLCLNDICGNCERDQICPLLLACPQIFQPVCGCDGVTYGSDCERRRAKVSKAHDGVCACEPVKCESGTQPVDRDGDGCAESCLAPCLDACDCENNPGIRLGNDCALECATCGNHWRCEAGYCVDTCGPKPLEECRQCGGFAGLSCRTGEVCDLPPGTCGWADLFGQCRSAGDACIALWDPVCGCDGRTYGNDCERLRAGAQLSHRGACETTR